MFKKIFSFFKRRSLKKEPEYVGEGYDRKSVVKNSTEEKYLIRNLTTKESISLDGKIAVTADFGKKGIIITGDKIFDYLIKGSKEGESIATIPID